jgi:hypothetical protein
MLTLLSSCEAIRENNARTEREFFARQEERSKRASAEAPRVAALQREFAPRMVAQARAAVAAARAAAEAARVRDWEDKANTQRRARISTRTRECRQQQANAGYSIW